MPGCCNRRFRDSTTPFTMVGRANELSATSLKRWCNVTWQVNPPMVYNFHYSNAWSRILTHTRAITLNGCRTSKAPRDYTSTWLEKLMNQSSAIWPSQLPDFAGWALPAIVKVLLSRWKRRLQHLCISRLQAWNQSHYGRRSPAGKITNVSEHLKPTNLANAIMADNINL